MRRLHFQPFLLFFFFFFRYTTKAPKALRVHPTNSCSLFFFPRPSSPHNLYRYVYTPSHHPLSPPSPLSGKNISSVLRHFSIVRKKKDGGCLLEDFQDCSKGNLRRQGSFVKTSLQREKLHNTQHLSFFPSEFRFFLKQRHPHKPFRICT